MKRNILDVEKIENDFNCVVTVIGELKRAGRGSYEYIPGLGDTPIFDRSPKEDDVYFSPGELLGRNRTEKRHHEEKRGAGVIVFQREAKSLSKLEVGRVLKNAYGSIIERLELNDDTSCRIATYNTGHYFTGEYVTKSRGAETVFDGN